MSFRIIAVLFSHISPRVVMCWIMVWLGRPPEWAYSWRLQSSAVMCSVADFAAGLLADDVGDLSLGEPLMARRVDERGVGVLLRLEQGGRAQVGEVGGADPGRAGIAEAVGEHPGLSDRVGVQQQDVLVEKRAASHRREIHPELNQQLFREGMFAGESARGVVVGCAVPIHHDMRRGA